MMMVLSKEKLKKIIAIIVVILLIASGLMFLLSKEDGKEAFQLVDLEKLPYTQGTKAESGYVALTCNVDLGWESEYVEGILDVLKKEEVKITFNVTGRWAEKNQDLLLRINEEGQE